MLLYTETSVSSNDNRLLPPSPLLFFFKCGVCFQTDHLEKDLSLLKLFHTKYSYFILKLHLQVVFLVLSQFVYFSN